MTTLPDYIVTRTIGSQVEAPGITNPDPENSAEILELLKDKLREHLRIEYGVVPAYESLRAQWDGDRHLFIAWWSPDTAKGVSFYGGPMDGLMMSIPSPHGNPPPEYRLAALGGRVRPTMAPFDAVRTQNVRYVKAGIDPHFDRWVYVYAD